MTDAAPPSADSSTRVDYVALAPGRSVGRYEILGVLGQGGFGITYRARDTQLDREVALKEYLPVALAVRQDGASVLPRSTEVADDFGWGRERFIEEGRTLATLHEAPSIVQVFDFLEENGTAYIVMELLRGETLDERIKAEGPLSPAELDAILWPLLEGLRQVHEIGFLHRDIKPANVLLGDENRPTLIDFGASRAAMADRTVAMTAIFTPGYAAPEQFSAAKQGPWTDIYGLAATLYHAITGKAPPNAFDRLMDDAYEPLASPAAGRLRARSSRGTRCRPGGACGGAAADHRRLARAARRGGGRKRGDGGDGVTADGASHAADAADTSDTANAAQPANSPCYRAANRQAVATGSRWPSRRCCSWPPDRPYYAMTPRSAAVTAAATPPPASSPAGTTASAAASPSAETAAAAQPAPEAARAGRPRPKRRRFAWRRRIANASRSRSPRWASTRAAPTAPSARARAR